jgi:hypothetical protein
MYQRGSWHRIFFAANSGIDELASLLNALKNAHNGGETITFANCKAYIHDDKSVQIVLLSPEASELAYGLENYCEELIISDPPGAVGPEFIELDML